MNPLPDAWPPRRLDAATATPVPMFPLPGVFLFPGQLMPLHIFEPRYRRMIEDSLDTSGRMVIATVLEQDRAQMPESPPVVPIAGFGEIARHDKLEDGRFLLWLCGLGRVRIEEVPSEQPYRQVKVQPLVEIEPTRGEVDVLRPRVTDALRRRTGTDLTEQHGEAPLGALADVLAQCITLPEQVMVELHGETDVAERARKVLSAERRFPAPQR